MVVDALEAVEVQEDHRERDAVALAALDLAAEVEVQVARVEELGQVVGDRELLGALEEDRVLDGDRAGLDQRQHQLRSARVKRPPSLLMISTTPIVRPRETSGAQRIERVWNCVRLSNLARETRVARGVVDDRGLAGLRHPPRDALAHLDAEGDTSPALRPERQLERQLLPLLVDHQHRPGLGRDELLDLLHDQLDHLAWLEDRVGGLHDVRQDRQPARGGARGRRSRRGGRRAIAAPRGRKMRQHRVGARIRGPPCLEQEVETEPLDALQRARVGRDRQAAHRPAGQRFAQPIEPKRRNPGRDLDQSGVEAPGGQRGRLPARAQELVGEPSGGKPLQPAPQQRPSENRDARHFFLSSRLWRAGAAR